VDSFRSSGVISGLVGSVSVPMGDRAQTVRKVAGGLKHDIPPSGVLLSDTFVVEQPRDWGTADRYLSRGRITPVVELGRQQLSYPGALHDVRRLSPPRPRGAGSGVGWAFED
jgi:hypothetical protein